MRITFLLFSILTVSTGIAQTKTYHADLEALKVILEKTPSYKAQIKGGRLRAYDSLYNQLANDTTGDIEGYQYFFNLSQLLFPIRDNHIGFYQLPDYSNFRNTASLDSFVATKEFLKYPHCLLNTDSLKAILATKPATEVEGIYHYGKYYTVGLFKAGGHKYTGVILDSDVRWWVKGQIAIQLYEYEPGMYKAIYGHPKFKNFMLQPNEKYRGQSLVNSYFYASLSGDIYSKQLDRDDYSNLPEGAGKFQLKNLEPDIQYLLIRTFQRNEPTSAQSKRFYDSIRNLLKAPYLVLDLRNNEGGARKETSKYYKLLKKYSRRGQLYILLNNGTISQAEIFTLKLSRLKNVITIGQPTNGMLTYGSNYGRRKRLPSGRFEVYPTDMRGSARLLQYEGVGVSPAILLKGDSNWIKQLIEAIRKN